jgi:tripeptidyl-peptidase-1
MCGKYTPTNVISLSYGLVEADFPTYYQIRQCNEFMKLGLQGVTIVFASGDEGVSDRNGNCLGPQQNIFSPDYPDCPYVTMVCYSRCCRTLIAVYEHHQLDTY